MTPLDFIQVCSSYTGNNCIRWPFGVNRRRGYGQLSFNGKMCRAHRHMCELVHGAAPSSKHVAAHSCHNRECITPRHLSWKTHSENMLDKRDNGTANTFNYWGRAGKLTPAQAAEILSLKGQKTKDDIADQFCVTESTVRKIHDGKIWAKRIERFMAGNKGLEPEDILSIRDDARPLRDIAHSYGVHINTIWRIRNGVSFKHITATTHTGR
jgi:hypothetical protein